MLGSFLHPDMFSETFPMSLFLPGITRYADIPHISALCAPRPLLLMNPIDGGAKVMSAGKAESLFSWTKRIYEMLESGGNFRMFWKSNGWEEFLLEWIDRSLD
jgi:hypothetical protein